MNIEITGEHKGVTKRIAVWECTKEVVPGEPIDVEEEIVAELRKHTRHYIQMLVKNEL
jgi:hypothetical protein